MFTNDKMVHDWIADTMNKFKRLIVNIGCSQRGLELVSYVTHQ